MLFTTSELSFSMKRDKEKAALVHPSPDAELEAWLRDVVAPRLNAVENGTAKLIPLEEARRLLLGNKAP
jgi:Putative addiction module component